MSKFNNITCTVISTLILLSFNARQVESIVKLPSLSKLKNIFRGLASTATLNTPSQVVTPPTGSSWVPKADRQQLDVRIDDTWYDLSIWRTAHPAGNLNLEKYST